MNATQLFPTPVRADRQRRRDDNVLADVIASAAADVVAIYPLAPAGYSGLLGLPRLPVSTCKICGKSDGVASVSVDLFDERLASFGCPAGKKQFTGCRNCHAEVFAKIADHELVLQREGEERTAAFEAMQREGRLERHRAKVGAEFARCTFDNYDVDAGNGAALTAVRSWATGVGWAHVPFLFVYGPTGLGKSHLAAAAWQELFGKCRNP